MIVDRRLVAVTVAALVAIAALAMTAASSPDRQAPAPSPVPIGVDEASAPPDRRPTELTGTSSRRPPATSSGSPPATVTAAPPATPSSMVVPSLPSDAPVEDLVAARRPDLAPTAAIDGHRDRVEATAGDVAATVVVSIWSWRYDDPSDRLAVELGDLVSTELAAALVPGLAELDRRRTAGEVAWAIVTPTNAPGIASADATDAMIGVTARHHVTTATSPEAVSERAATLRLHRSGRGWQVVELTVTL